ncbi:MAG: hypothetical protein LC664_08740, partial [Flavobacteriales bacterium]|nr:hypothetical protein [Flavobacteriales bacterium]
VLRGSAAQNFPAPKHPFGLSLVCGANLVKTAKEPISYTLVLSGTFFTSIALRDLEKRNELSVYLRSSDHLPIAPFYRAVSCQKQHRGIVGFVSIIRTIFFKLDNS